MSALIIRPVSPFAAATLIPIPLLALGALVGGWFILAAFLYMTALRMLLDRLIATAGPEAGPGSEFPAAEQLSRALAWAHFPLLLIGVAGLSGATSLSFLEGVGVLFAFGLYFGQVSNSNAHELIHRRDRGLFRLGKWVLISLLYGHHVTAHLKVHHRFVATPDDPNTARLGEGFWSFAQVAWAGAFVAGWEIERSIAKIRERELPFWRHPYAEYVAGGIGFAVASIVIFGASGLIAYLMLAIYAQLQLLLSDYVQHYGLRRRQIGDDRYEQVAPWHSWNAPHWFSGGLMLNAPRHSEHHTNPGRPFPELSLPAADEGPRLPYSLPVMGAVALVPPLWRRLMDRRATVWQQRIDEGAIERRAPPALLPAPVKPETRRRKAKAKTAAETGMHAPADAAEAEAMLAEVAALAAAGARSEAPALPPEPLAGSSAAAPEAAAPQAPGAEELETDGPGSSAGAETETALAGSTADRPVAAEQETVGARPEDAADEVRTAPAEAVADVPAEAVAEEAVEARAEEPRPDNAAVSEELPEDQHEGRHLLRRLEQAEATLAAEAGPPQGGRRPAAQGSDGGVRTPQLWAGKERERAEAATEPADAEAAAEPADLPTFRSARSAALFQPDGAEMPAEAEPQEDGPDPEIEPGNASTQGSAPGADEATATAAEAGPPQGQDSVAAAVAQLVASGPKPPPRGRMLPSIEGEPTEAGPPGLRERLRQQVHGAALAARALAAVLRGAPPAPPDAEDEY
jgi:alkane 1-monooxygenase